MPGEEEGDTADVVWAREDYKNKAVMEEEAKDGCTQPLLFRDCRLDNGFHRAKQLGARRGIEAGG